MNLRDLLLSALFSTSAVASADIQLLPPTDKISVYDAVLDVGPKLFNALEYMFDGLYGGDPEKVEVPSGVLAKFKAEVLPSAYAIAVTPRNAMNGSYYDFFDDKNSLPGYSSYMLTRPSDTNGQQNPEYLGNQPTYSTPGLSGYQPNPSITSEGSSSNWYQTTGSNGQ